MRTDRCSLSLSLSLSPSQRLPVSKQGSVGGITLKPPPEMSGPHGSEQVKTAGKGISCPVVVYAFLTPKTEKLSHGVVAD